LHASYLLALYYYTRSQDGEKQVYEGSRMTIPRVHISQTVLV